LKGGRHGKVDQLVGRPSFVGGEVNSPLTKKDPRKSRIKRGGGDGKRTLLGVGSVVVPRGKIP